MILIGVRIWIRLPKRLGPDPDRNKFLANFLQIVLQIVSMKQKLAASVVDFFSIKCTLVPCRLIS
jgi:hypothetical protein